VAEGAFKIAPRKEDRAGDLSGVIEQSELLNAVNIHAVCLRSFPPMQILSSFDCITVGNRSQEGVSAAEFFVAFFRRA
jgi:hypothetical protein